MPGPGGTKGPEFAVGGGPPASGTAALVKIGAPVQVGLFGPKRVNTTVPVGAGAPGVPVTVAVSEMGLPTVTGVIADVTMVGVAWLTTDASLGAPHGLVTDG